MRPSHIAVIITAAAAVAAGCSSSAKSSATDATVAGASVPGTASGESAGTTSGTSPTTSNGATPDACSLLTTADITSATHLAFDAPKAEAPQQTQYGTYTACTWTNPESPFTFVRVNVWDKSSAYDDSKGQVTEMTPNTGVGDESFVASGASVFAVVDGHTLFVQYSNSDNSDSQNLPASEQLAKAAAARL